LEVFGSLQYTNHGSGLSSLGYISVGDLMLAANQALKLDETTLGGDPNSYEGVAVRDLQNALSNALSALTSNQLELVAGS
jgi:hypothetical protein